MENWQDGFTEGVKRAIEVADYRATLTSQEPFAAPAPKAQTGRERLREILKRLGTQMFDHELGCLCVGCRTENHCADELEQWHWPSGV